MVGAHDVGNSQCNFVFVGKDHFDPKRLYVRLYGPHEIMISPNHVILSMDWSMNDDGNFVFISKIKIRSVLIGSFSSKK